MQPHLHHTPRPGQTRPIYPLPSSSTILSNDATHLIQQSHVRKRIRKRRSYYNNGFSPFPTVTHQMLECTESHVWYPAEVTTQLLSSCGRIFGPSLSVIESFVSAFGSISMALESTFTAIYSLAVCRWGSRPLGSVKEVFTSLAIFRFMRWLFRRILYLVGSFLVFLLTYPNCTLKSLFMSLGFI